MAHVTTIVSGGQTGVDRGALRAARELGLAIRGWCPPGRESEAGPVPQQIPLRETPTERSPGAPEVPRSLRTEWNVRDSDATLVLSPATQTRRPEALDPGTAWAVRCAGTYGRPVLVVDPWDPAAPAAVASWLAGRPICSLNVAGPSEAAFPGIEEQAASLLLRILVEA